MRGNTRDDFVSAGVIGDCTLTQTAAGAPAGMANVVVNPRFVGAAGLVSNDQLLAVAPRVDACVSGPATDLVGVPRPTRAGFDRGAFER